MSDSEAVDSAPLESPREPTRHIDEAFRGENLVFVVGCPRSGTTWLQRLLATHPRVRTGQESHLFDFYIGPQLHKWADASRQAVNTRGGVGLGCYVSKEEYEEIVRSYMIGLIRPLLAGVPQDAIFVEKTPAHALFLSEINAFLPRSRIIHVVRDPRGVTASLLAASRSWGPDFAPSTVAGAASMWNAHVNAVHRVAPTLPASTFLQVRFEDLHAQPATVLKRVAEFLDLEWTESAIAASVEANTAEILRQGGGTHIPVGGAFATATGTVVEPRDFVRDAGPTGWMKDLSPRQRALVRLLTGHEMEKFGYATRPGKVSRLLRAGVRLAIARATAPPRQDGS